MFFASNAKTADIQGYLFLFWRHWVMEILAS